VRAAALLLLAACGDDEKDDKGESAVKKCNALIAAFCERVTKCAVDADILDETYPASELRMDCDNTIDSVLECASADQVGDSYEQCLSDVKKVSCEVSNTSLLDNEEFASPPASCDDVILFER
jgi:hypothetical protein